MNDLAYPHWKRFIYTIITIVSLTGCKQDAPPTRTSILPDTIAFNPATLKTKKEKEIYEKSKAFFEDQFRYAPLNGGFLVAKDGKILFESYKGTVHLHQNDTINMQTPLHIASTSKTFTAMCVLRLAEKKLLNTDHDIKTYFPAFPYEGITITHLLNHRSGLANYMNVMNPKEWTNEKRVSNQDVLDFFVRQKPALQGTPGKQFAYCNTNYVLLALIIEKVSGRKYADFLKDEIFTPVGMRNTIVCNSDYQKNHAPSYRENGNEEAITWLDDTYGDKNICSTPRDLLRWDQALYQHKLFSKQTTEAAFTPYSFEKKGINNYGLGWRMYVLGKKKKVIYHNGWWHGSNSSFFRLIDDRITIIAIGNKMNKQIYKLKPLIESISSVRFSNQEEDGL
jgi:CubicO group peptidase (beta-lactamase class C family)